MNRETYIAFVAGISLVVALAVFILVVIVIYHYRRKNHLSQLLHLQNEFKRELLQSQLEIKEQTFATISQEIHDNIGQALTLAKLQLNQLQYQNPECDAETPRKLIAQAITDLRDLAHSLNPDRIQAIPLEQNLEHDLQLLEKSGPIKTRFAVLGTRNSLTGEQKIILYRIFQELMNNTIRHSQADTLLVTLLYEPDQLVLKVQDNGIGFDDFAKPGIGLTNIQNRAAIIGATVHIDKAFTNGVRITITLPHQNNPTYA